MSAALLHRSVRPIRTDFRQAVMGPMTTRVYAVTARALSRAAALAMIAAVLCALLSGFTLSTAQAAEIRLPEAQEARLRELARELRCLVCQNESLAESHAPLAADLREEIREQIRTGSSDTEVIDYLVARYGDFITYKPPFNARTLGLWLGPFMVLLMLLGALWSFHRRNRLSRPPAVSAAEAQDVHEEVRRLKQQYGSNDD